jgi:hypothetical protein
MAAHDQFPGLETLTDLVDLYGHGDQHGAIWDGRHDDRRGFGVKFLPPRSGAVHGYR